MIHALKHRFRYVNKGEKKLNKLFQDLITLCDKGLEKRIKTEGCDDCKCPTGSDDSCKGSCKRKLIKTLKSSLHRGALIFILFHRLCRRFDLYHLNDYLLFYPCISFPYKTQAQKLRKSPLQLRRLP